MDSRVAMQPDKQVKLELEQLRERLAEAEATIAAIRNGEVDALVVSGDEGEQVFTLHGADQPYRLFVESMQQGALTVARDGTIFYANKRFAEMSGIHLEKAMGSSFANYVSPADRAEVSAALQRGIAGHQRVFLQHASGSLVPAQLTYVPQESDSAETVCVVITDTTEVQERQILTDALERLRSAQQQLRQQNHDLQEARQAAETASSAKDQFLAQLSHELRTPLTPVLMALGDLEGADLPPVIEEELNLIRRNVELQASLIDDLLDLSRVITGKLSLTLAPLDMHSLIREVVRSCAPECTAKKLEIGIDLRSSRAIVNGDPVRLRQVIWNVLRNAVKFTPAGGRITVTSEMADEELRIMIEDTGIGISDDALSRIFSPFEQASQSITRRFGGMGLGLAITQRLLQMHGGSVSAWSEGEGKGSTFRIDLPLAGVLSMEAAEAPSRQSEKAPLRGRILLVEDHEDTRVLLSRLLSERHRVQTADSVQSAVAAAETGSFDLLISDLGLPDGTGYDVMMQVRQRHTIPGIALSGYGADADMERSRKAGFTRHLVKPVALKDLLLAIEETLSSRSD